MSAAELARFEMYADRCNGYMLHCAEGDYVRYDAATAVIDALRARITELEARQVVDLHEGIINLPCDLDLCTSKNWVLSFKEGHKIARHSAAELVLKIK